MTMFRCEVKLPRTGEWVGLDESSDATTRPAFTRAVQRAFPILKSREWRVVEIDKPPAKTLFTLRVPMRLPK